MITTINNILLQINIEVTFKLNSLTDKQTYRGRIIGIGGYDIACVYHDVVAPHNNMESHVAQMEPAALTYLILKCDDGMIRPFATAWIKEKTFDRTDNVTDMQIICHNLSEMKKAEILTYLRDYYCPVTVVS